MFVSTFNEENGIINPECSEEKIRPIEEKPVGEPLKERNIQETLNMLTMTKPPENNTTSDENKKTFLYNNNDDSTKRNKSPFTKLEIIAENFESEDTNNLPSGQKEKKLDEEEKEKKIENGPSAQKPKLRTSKKNLSIKAPDSDSKATFVKDEGTLPMLSYSDSLYATPRVMKTHSNFCENNWFEKGSALVFDFNEEDLYSFEVKPVLPLQKNGWAFEHIEYKVWEKVLDYAGFSTMLNFRLVSQKGLNIFHDYFDKNLTKIQTSVDRTYVNIKKDWRDCIAVKIKSSYIFNRLYFY